MSQQDLIEKDDAGAKSLYHRQPGRTPSRKQEFRAFVLELKRLAIQQRYTRRELASWA
jgi:hypothetical protein